jgi:PAS domain S-box-containing protein
MAALAPGADKRYSMTFRIVPHERNEVIRVVSRGMRAPDAAGAQRVLGILMPLETGEPAPDDLLVSLEFVQALLTNSRVVAWARDEQHHYTFLSDNYQRHIGLSRAEWYGKTPFDLWPPQVAERINRDHEALLADGRPREMIDEMVMPDGKATYWAANKFVFHDASGRRCVGGLSVDVSAHRRAEAARRASEMRLDAFLDNERFLAWVKTPDGRFVFMNETFRHHFGIARESVDRIHVEDLWMPDVVEQMAMRERRVLEEDHALQFIDEMPDHSGRRHWWLKIKFPIKEAGGVTHIGCLAIDISEQMELRQARDQLRVLFREMQAGQEDERKRLARDIHDVLGGTLSVIKSQLGLLCSEAVRSDRQRAQQMVDKLREMIDALLVDTDRMVDWLRPASLDHLGLDAALSRLTQEFSLLYGIDCQIDSFECGLNLLEAQVVALYRIAQEGLLNIAKHAAATRARLTLRVEGRRLLLEIDDNGRGMPTMPASRQGFGLLGIRERVRILNGICALEVSPLGGVRLSVSVPL